VGEADELAERERVVERVLARVGEQYAERTPFESDRGLAPEICAEARPAVQSLELALALETADDENSLDHHEGIAMTTLLGRRVALRGATPSAASAIVPAIAGGFEAEGTPLSPRFTEVLAVALFEGYVRGREERVREELAADALAALPTLVLSPRTRALILSGRHDAEDLEPVIEEFGRVLFRTEAVAGVVDLSGLQAPGRSLAAVVFSAQVNARTVGARCFFSGVDAAWEEAIVAADLDRADLEICESFGGAVERAIQLEGRGPIARGLHKLLGKRAK